MSDEQTILALTSIREQAEQFGRDPDSIGSQQQLAPPPRSDEDKLFYTDLDQVAERASIVAAMGFDWTAVNVTAMFQAGARSVDAMIEQLQAIHDRIRNESS
jgi:hypothetical protein